jgi:GT2 family glycosyltransferase
VRTVTIVVPTFRRPEALRLTLGGLMALDHPVDVVVVDDGDEPGTAAIVDAVRGETPVTLLRQRQRGAASARNAGARVAQGELLLFLDDDMVVAPDHVSRHLATHAAYPGSFVGSDRWYTPASLAQLSSTPFGRYRVALERDFRAQLDERRLDDDCAETPIVAACDLSLARAAFEDLGGFDEAFPHAGAEDQDLSLRAKQAGLRLVRNYAIRPQHEEDMVTLPRFGWREERGAETVVVLGRRFPEAVGRFAENGPLARGDRPALAAKKLVKGVLGGDRALAALHRVATLLERLRVPEPVLRRVYRAILAVHISRGYRRGLRT